MFVLQTSADPCFGASDTDSLLPPPPLLEQHDSIGSREEYLDMCALET